MKTIDKALAIINEVAIKEAHPFTEVKRLLRAAQKKSEKLTDALNQALDLLANIRYQTWPQLYEFDSNEKGEFVDRLGPDVIVASEGILRRVSGLGIELNPEKFDEVIEDCELALEAAKR